MAEVDLALGLLAIVVSLVGALVGGISWLRHRYSVGFWYLLRTAQLATLVFVLFEGVVYATGARAEDGLHYLYVSLPVVASLLAEATRGAAASHEVGDRDVHRMSPEDQESLANAIIRRETGIMTVSLFVVAFLVWRALDTTAGMF